MKPRRIRDPVHGLIVFGEGKSRALDETDSIAWDLLNTREFQRLRRIRQLGFSDLVYPGATHSRFAHSIGVYHTARRLLDLIRRREVQKRIDESVLTAITKNDREYRERVTLLAALLHDIGHGPFSHVFERVVSDLGRQKDHEHWSAEIVANEDTEVHSVLADNPDCPSLPQDIAALLRSDHPRDMYATVVSSQFDADRLDYVQRDRYMTGVQSAHIDLDWLFDCLEVGPLTVGDINDPVPVPCLYLNPKGRRVAEEYLLARKELYRMVYYHKTSRGAEVLLSRLLNTAIKLFVRMAKQDPDKLSEGDRRLRSDPVLRYLAAESPSLPSYLELDDYAVWMCVGALAEASDRDVAALAARLRDRVLFKCVDLGAIDSRFLEKNSNIRQQLSVEMSKHEDLHMAYDEAESELYTSHDFRQDPLKMILVKVKDSDREPQDISQRSNLPSAESVRIYRAYLAGDEPRNKLSDIIGRLAT